MQFIRKLLLSLSIICAVATTAMAQVAPNVYHDENQTMIVSVSSGSSAAMQMEKSNGYYDASQESFVWSGGGNEPLVISAEEALSQERVAAVLPADVRRVLLTKMAVARRGPPNHVVRDGDREDLMLSGKGWIALQVVAMESKWKEGRSRQAWVVYHTDRTGRQWRMTHYEVCANISLTLIAAPIQCRCEPEKGDVCPQNSTPGSAPKQSQAPIPLLPQKKLPPKPIPKPDGVKADLPQQSTELSKFLDPNKVQRWIEAPPSATRTLTIVIKKPSS